MLWYFESASFPPKVLEIVGQNSRGTNNVLENERGVLVPGAKSRMVELRR